MDIYRDPLSPSSSIMEGGSVPSNVLREPPVFDIFEDPHSPSSEPVSRSQKPGSQASSASSASGDTELISSQILQEFLANEKRNKVDRMESNQPEPLAHETGNNIGAPFNPFKKAWMNPEQPEQELWKAALRGHNAIRLGKSLMKRMMYDESLQPDAISTPVPDNPSSSQEDSQDESFKESESPTPPVIEELIPCDRSDLIGQFPLNNFSPSPTGYTYTVEELLCILWFSSTTTLPLHTISQIFNRLYPSHQTTQYDINRVITKAVWRLENTHRPFWIYPNILERPTGPDSRPCSFGVNCNLVRRTRSNDIEGRLRISRSLWHFPFDFGEPDPEHDHICLVGVHPLRKLWCTIRYPDRVEVTPNTLQQVRVLYSVLVLSLVASVWVGWHRFEVQDRVDPVIDNGVAAVQALGNMLVDTWEDARKGGRKYVGNVLVNAFCLVAVVYLLDVIWSGEQ